MNTITIPDTELVEIRRDGQYITSVSNGALLPWFHQQHSFSMDHALEFEGYSLHPVEERFVVFAEYEENGVRFEKVISIKETQLAAKRAYLKFGRYEGAHNPSIKGYGYRTELSHNGVWVAA